MKETPKKRAKVKVVLCKCSRSHGRENSSNLFGIRIEEQNDDWVRTWAFKLDEEKAKHEGFDTETTRGSMNPTEDYPGCPFCGSYIIAQCGCGKLFCWHGEKSSNGHTTATCPWCGQTGEFHTVETLNVQGGGL
jgi:hypothetical protein